MFGQLPSAPTSLSVARFPGDGTKLIATYSRPLHGDGIRTYRIQASSSRTFESVVSVDYVCELRPVREVVTVTTKGGSGSGCSVTGGSFSLTLGRGGVLGSTLPIAYNAVATIAEETSTTVGTSMQAQLLRVGLVDQVAVTRQDLGAGTFEWTITFLVDGPMESLTVKKAELNSKCRKPKVDIATLVKGETPASCTGSQARWQLFSRHCC